MKRSHLFIFLFLLLTDSSLAQQPATLARVGSEIDSYERMYFGLFPKIGDFKHATIVQSTNDSIRFVISQTSSQDTMMALAQRDRTMLSYYLSTFDSLSNQVDQVEKEILLHPFEGLIRSHIIDPQRHTQQEPEYVTIWGSPFLEDVCILAVGVSSIVVVRGDCSDGLQSQLNAARVLNARNVQAVEHRDVPFFRNPIARFLVGTLSGAAILASIIDSYEKDRDEMWPLVPLGGVITGFFTMMIGQLYLDNFHPIERIEINRQQAMPQSAREALARYAFYPDKPPPEIMRLIERQTTVR